jgi:glycosyltransferase involved in cell wall biosynthesis
LNTLELCTSPDFGGLEIHMRDFSRWLAQKKDCRLFLGVALNSRLHKSLKDLNTPIIVFPKRIGRLPFLNAFKLSRSINSLKIDIVHVHWKFDLPLTALAKRISEKSFKLVHTRQMSLPDKKHDPYHKFIYNSLDCFIAITEKIAGQARKNLPIEAGKIQQVYYGVEAPPEIPSDVTNKLREKFNIKNNFNICLFGRISEFKGQHLLIEAIDMLRREGIKINAMIIGDIFDQDYFESLKIQIENKGLSNQIRFLEFFKNPIELMTCFDALVLTTKRETFGLVLIEAMHAGIPVIGSNEGGVPEIINHEETGLLFESWDYSSLAQEIKKLVLDKELRTRLADAGKKIAAQKFNAEIQYQKVYSVFENIT